MSSDPTASGPPPKRPKCPIKEKVTKAPPIPLPVMKVSGVNSEWCNIHGIRTYRPLPPYNGRVLYRPPPCPAGPIF